MSRVRPIQKESPAKRFRNTLFHMWQNNNNGFEEFNDFYEDRMEKLIEYYERKNKKKKK